MSEIIVKAETDPVEAKKKDRFIEYLELLAEGKNLAALANLRRGLGKSPKSSLEMYPYLDQFLSEKSEGKKPNYKRENAVFIVAPLFAYYWKAQTNIKDLGASLLKYQKETESDSVEKRFVALLNAEAGELPDYLRQIVGLLKSKEIAVNWEQLFTDVQYWEASNNNSKYESVQRKWARSFWGNSNNKTIQNSQENSGGEQQ